MNPLPWWLERRTDGWQAMALAEGLVGSLGPVRATWQEAAQDARCAATGRPPEDWHPLPGPPPKGAA